jgi:chromosome segregation ATPase
MRYHARYVTASSAQCSARLGERRGLPSRHMHGSRDEVVPIPPPFEIVLRGFDRQQVIDHVNALKARVGALGAERDAALQRAADLSDKLEQGRREAAEAARQVEHLRRDAQDAAAELDRLQRSPLAGATARIQRMLQMAEDEAAELRASAEQETRSLRENARAESDRLLAETRQLCARLEAESASRRRAEEADSASRRQQAEQRTEQEIAHRQAQTQDWVSDYQVRSIAALYLLIQLAGERLNNRVVRVKQQVTAARTLRSEVTGQLSAVQRLLTEALGVVEQPTSAEQAEREQAEREQAEREQAQREQAQREQAQPTQAQPDEQATRTKAAKPSDDTPSPQPAGGSGRSGRGRAASPQQDQTVRLRRPQPADQPTARFGLHP